MDNFIIYNTDDGQAKVSLLAKDGSVWCTQAQMAELFGRQQPTISKHIANILNDGELDEKSNIHFMNIANSDKAEAPRVEKGRKYHLREFQKILTLFFHIKKPYPYIRMNTAVPMEMAVSRWRVMSHAMRRITTVLYHVPPLFPMNGGFSNGTELQIYHPQASEDEWRGELPADPLLPGSGWEVEAEVQGRLCPAVSSSFR